ncbi:type II secretion system F family protein [Candidatus Micrarchaeota archaeon]|nr:type II secretion system F family protein [Candidatus Micrarchaeota archaeon]
MDSDKKENWFTQKIKQLEVFYAATGYKFTLPVFIAMMFAVGLVAFIVLLLLLNDLAISLVALLAIMSLVISIPLAARNGRIEKIEAALPDALKHMALVLKAGGTTESALEEVSNARYGPLSTELGFALKKLRGGQNFDEALIESAEHSGSLLFKRTVLIVVDAKRSGAGLADVMFAIAEDARDVLHIKRERISRTTMHVLFLVVSGIILSPFIFGFAISIVNYINEGVSSAVKNVAAPACWPSKALCAIHLPLTICDLNLVLILFLVFTAVITSIALGIIREGKTQKYVLYTPIMILVSLIIYEIGKFGSNLIVQSKGIQCSAGCNFVQSISQAVNYVLCSVTRLAGGRCEAPITCLQFNSAIWPVIAICLIVIFGIIFAITRPRRVTSK